MNCRIVLLLAAFSPTFFGCYARSQVRNTRPVYARVELCKIPVHRIDRKYVSFDAEFRTALPHGIFLTDRRCTRILQIDFADTGLDLSVVFLEKHIFELNGARGTFRGTLKRDPDTRRVYLWLESVVDLQSTSYVPAFERDEPIQLPQPEFPKWPPD